MIKIVTPDIEIEEIHEYDYVVFLAGPIVGSENWQRNVCESIKDLNTDKKILIANPRRKIIHDKLSKKEFEKQVLWEIYYMDAAAKNGCLFFWCAAPEKDYDGNSYARTTRIELGRYLESKKYNDKLNILVGLDIDFPGKEYIDFMLKLYSVPTGICSFNSHLKKLLKELK